MNQKPKHTKPSPSSFDAVAYGYEYRYDDFGGSAQARHGVSWRHTVTEHSSYRDGERRYPELSRRVDQRGSNDIRFISITIGITGKERDAETGFDYFGTRYYASDISVWLSCGSLG